ncbi:MAG: hypothetical protein ABL917_03445 [Parcubacteria group bacterium]
MDFDKSKIERLKRGLYSRNEQTGKEAEYKPIPKQDIDVPTSWGQPKSFDFSPEVMKQKNNSFFNKFFMYSLGFFLISLSVALFIFFGGINMISSNNLDVKITAPTSISSGEELNIGLSILNQNRTDIEEVFLFINYPSGAQAIGDGGKALTHEKISLGKINKGSVAEHSIRALLFGEKDAVKTFTFRLEYKVNGSNAIFSKEKTYDVSIGSSPILLNVDFPKEINSGQEVKLSIDLTSNSAVTVKDSLVKIEYPYGFTYKSSSIKPLRDDSVWVMGDLKNGEKKVLTVSGVLVGQNMEDRSFRIFVGTKSPDISKDFETPLAESDATIGIRKSFFNLEVTPSSGPVAEVDQNVQFNINWQNTLPDKILNTTVEATLSGNIFDRNSVTANNSGFFRSTDNTVFWDKNTTRELAEMIPGESGRYNISVASISDLARIRSIKNPHIDLHVVMKGDRSGSDSGEVSSSMDVVVKIVSQLSLTAKSYRNMGGINNTGPIPPKADVESTYSINWVLTNTTNDLKGAVVSGTLPVGVVWKDEVSPSQENVSYDPDTRVVTWNVGNISAGAGFANSPKSVFFKVGIVPSVNQVRTKPVLISDISATATDTYTATVIEKMVTSVTTDFSDTNFTLGSGDVVR